MYCPNCQKEVQTKREDINWALLVLLTIFTAGIGVLVYLSAYFKKPMNKCIYCNAICFSREQLHLNNENRNEISLNNHSSSEQVLTTIKKTPLKKGNAQSHKNHKYCSNCGLEIDHREKLNFCAYCGFQLH